MSRDQNINKLCVLCAFVVKTDCAMPEVRMAGTSLDYHDDDDDDDDDECDYEHEPSTINCQLYRC